MSMESYETYAKRIIAGLDQPDKFNHEILESPLVGAYDDLNGQLVDVELGQDGFDDQYTDTEIASEDVTQIENGILASGLECLAFYKSIRYESQPPYKGKWGIFIFEFSLQYLAKEINHYYLGKYSLKECYTKARNLLYFHERFHYRFDSWVISHESATGRPLYENYRNSIYHTYHPQIFIYEETLANLDALSYIKSRRIGIDSFAKEFMLSQPGAYSNIINIDKEDYRSRLAAQLFYGKKQILFNPHTLPEHSEYLANPKTPRNSDMWCPVRIVKDVDPSRFVVPGISLPAINEIENGFIKKYLDGKEIRTDHKFFKIDNGSKIKCPNPHTKNVKLHEFKNITGKAGLRTNEYFKERDKTKKWGKNVPRKDVKSALF